MRSHDDLLQESIYKDRPGDFNELLILLTDRKLLSGRSALHCFLDAPRFN